eukprot:CAMPEP_0116045734 /NCGR_PEP_ID=MMETSP0321-20121206/27802_1 /TAXON_ID=163516 /ORGANISM="Leptocylindrus danicus var. danicus, Strain B650" /LENGTH=152 /DNA_ID=CAMNT_0003527139 /DNA_START=157 /DNA_END=611 /DNA_ORIENTATION=+
MEVKVQTNYPWWTIVANVVHTEHIYRLTYGINPEKADIFKSEVDAKSSLPLKMQTSENRVISDSLESEINCVDDAEKDDLAGVGKKKQQRNGDQFKDNAPSGAVVAQSIEACTSVNDVNDRSLALTRDGKDAVDSVVEKEPPFAPKEDDDLA